MMPDVIVFLFLCSSAKFRGGPLRGKASLLAPISPGPTAIRCFEATETSGIGGGAGGWVGWLGGGVGERGGSTKSAGIVDCGGVDLILASCGARQVPWDQRRPTGHICT